jgi:hypothetical protein
MGKYKIYYKKHPTPSSCRTSYGARIDQLVYKLYALTPEEIKIVESNNIE